MCWPRPDQLVLVRHGESEWNKLNLFTVSQTTILTTLTTRSTQSRSLAPDRSNLMAEERAPLSRACQHIALLDPTRLHLVLATTGMEGPCSY